MPKPFKRSSKRPNRGQYRGNQGSAKFVAEPFTQHHEVTVTIESLSNQGDGVAKVDAEDANINISIIKFS